MKTTAAKCALALLWAAGIAAQLVPARAQVPSLADMAFARGAISATNTAPLVLDASPGSAVYLQGIDRAAVTIQVRGTYTGALSVQVSTDNTSYATVTAPLVVSLTTGAATAEISSGENGVYYFATAGASRVRVTALGAFTGTAQVALRHTSAPLPPVNRGAGAMPVAVSNFPAPAASMAVSNLPAVQTVAGTVAVSNMPAYPASQSVSGAVAVTNLPAVQQVGGSVSVSNFPAPPAYPASQAVTGIVAVSNLPAVQPVSGAVSVANFPASTSVSNFPGSQAVTGTFWQQTQPVSLAAAPTTPVTGTFWQATQPVSLASAPVTTVAGGAAHSAPRTGNSVPVAGQVVTAADTTLAAGDVSYLSMTSAGQLVTKPYSPRETDWSASSGVAVLAGVGAVSLKAAGAAGVRNCVTALQAFNSSTVVATAISVLDGAAVLWTGFAPLLANGAQVSVAFPTPLCGSPATAMSLQLGTAGAAVYYNAQGFQSF